MTRNSVLSAIEQYGTIDTESGVEGASSHRLIQILMTGALSRIARAAGHMRRGEIAAKGENIGVAISTISGLRASLDLDAGGTIAVNLDALYDYMLRSLLEANLHDDVEKLDEVQRLAGEIKAAWDALPAGLAAPATSAPDQSSEMRYDFRA